MIFAYLSHVLSLNDVSDTLPAGALATVRNAQPPSRKGLSHANKVRKELFYEPLHHLTGHFPQFGQIDASFKLPRRIKRVINLVDSTTIQLFANGMDWAKHRRRKAAAKCHMMLDALTFLPRFAVVTVLNLTMPSKGGYFAPSLTMKQIYGKAAISSFALLSIILFSSCSTIDENLKSTVGI